MCMCMCVHVAGLSGCSTAIGRRLYVCYRACRQLTPMSSITLAASRQRSCMLHCCEYILCGFFILACSLICCSLRAYSGQLHNCGALELRQRPHPLLVTVSDCARRKPAHSAAAQLPAVDSVNYLMALILCRHLCLSLMRTHL